MRSAIDNADGQVYSDYLTMGGVLGEFSLLTGTSYETIATFETSVQVGYWTS